MWCIRYVCVWDPRQEKCFFFYISLLFEKILWKKNNKTYLIQMRFCSFYFLPLLGVGFFSIVLFYKEAICNVCYYIILDNPSFNYFVNLLSFKSYKGWSRLDVICIIWKEVTFSSSCTMYNNSILKITPKCT